MTREFIDIHSHILPSVDDGCTSIEQSVNIIKQMSKLGVTDLFLTPHYCRRRKHITDIEDIKNAYNLLCLSVSKENINIRLHLGTEMEYSQDGARYIKEGRVSTLAGSRYILIEFPPYVSKNTVLYSIRQIYSLGLVPVIAHIERYKSVIKDIEFVSKLRHTGALVQVNIRSITKFNLKIRKFLKRAVSLRYIDFLAGDVHTFPLGEKEMDKCAQFIIKYSNKEYLHSLLSSNAKNTILR